MKVIYNKIIPFGRKFHAINLFGVLFAKGPCNRIVINHESIHTAQIRELWYIPFYILYLLEWLVRLALCRNSFKSYMNISYEREAYANEADLDYLGKRRRFAFLNYMKIKS